MTLETGILIGALAAIAVVIVAGLLRRHARVSGTLPRPMLLVLRITLGIVFVILGVIGSLLPILQGWVFFVLAALVLFPQSRFAVKACDKAERKMPRLIGWLRRRGIGVPRDA